MLVKNIWFLEKGKSLVTKELAIVMTRREKFGTNFEIQYIFYCREKFLLKRLYRRLGRDFVSGGIREFDFFFYNKIINMKRKVVLGIILELPNAFS